MRDLFSLSSDYDVSDKKVLKNNGNINHTQMEKMVGKVYVTFDKKRKKQETINADFQDLEELKQIAEIKIKEIKNFNILIVSNFS